MKKKLHLHWQILIALVLGVFIGVVFPDVARHFEWLGTLFLRLLRMIIVPLIFASIFTGVASLGSAGNLQRLGLKTISYFAATSILAAATGLVLVNLINPGFGVDLGLSQTLESIPVANQSLGQILLNIVPTNIIDSLANADFVGIIFFAILFGIFSTKVADNHRDALLGFFSATFEVMMKITLFVVKFTPIGVFGLTTGIVAEQGGEMGRIFAGLGKYILTVVIGLGIHAMITLPLLMKFLVNANFLKHYKGMSIPLLTAFSTASSSATLPLTMQAVTNNSGVSKATANFVLPVGATVNMDGTALYHAVSALFIAQVYGIELSIVQQLIVLATALLASIGAAGIPMAGLIIITLIMSAVGLPLEGIGLLLLVDRILDPLRTTVNVLGDTCGAVVVAKSEGEKLHV
ncbi:MAG TPA: dicarboxylate/amino acid:cation symporter [Bacteroidales bacterium]|nr:dicarboxylate/amino acid:cation symporter [Bacteroidales bacterium]